MSDRPALSNSAMSLDPLLREKLLAFLHPDLCANTKEKIEGQNQPCQNSANQICNSCKLVQYCSKDCQIADWPQHKEICKSDLMKTVYVPDWTKQGRVPAFITGTETTLHFGMEQYLWGNMPAINLLKGRESENLASLHPDISLLFAASGDIRNVIKSVTEGLSEGHKYGRCSVVINDINFMVVARNAILLLVALSLESDEAAVIMLHVWYSALLPEAMIETLKLVVLQPIIDVCDKIKDKPQTSLQSKTFSFGKRSLRLVLNKRQWDELKNYFSLPQNLTRENAQKIRRRVTLAPERIDFVQRMLCNSLPPNRVATMKFREDGMLLPHGASREKFCIPNPTLFHDHRQWPMKDDASPFEGWDYNEVIQFTPKASNDIVGSLFFYLKDTLLRFCRRLQDLDLHFELFQVDARQLPRHLGASLFDRIEVSNISDRCYLGPEMTLFTFAPFLKPKATHPDATLLLLFLNAVAEAYLRIGSLARFQESFKGMQKFIPLSRRSFTKIAGGPNAMDNTTMIRISSCDTMFGDFDKAFGAFLKDVQMTKLAKQSGLNIKDNHSIIEPWPLRVTDKNSKAEFDIMCAKMHTRYERYMEFEKV